MNNIVLKERVRKKILNLKKEKNFTQATFAEAVGLSENAIGKIERGESIPTLDTLEKIAQGLNMPVKEFFEFGIESTGEYDEAVRRLNGYLENRPTKDILLVREIAEKIFDPNRKI